MIVVPEWTGAEARALRKALRMTMERFSEHLGAAVRTVADWEKLGAQIVPIPVMQACLDTALSRADDEAKARFAALTSDVTGKMSDSSDRNGNGDHADRRTATRALAAGFAAAAFPLDALERIADTRHANADETLVGAYEHMADEAYRVYRVAFAEPLLVAVAHQASAVRDVLRRPLTDRYRQRLHEVSVGLHSEAGMLALNLHELDKADLFFAKARVAAHDAGNDRLQAQALQVSTHLLCSLRYGGRGGNDNLALTLVEKAAVHAVNADAHTRGETFRRLAEQRAIDGDDRGFQAALHQAQAELDRVDGSERGFSARSGAFLSPRLLPAAAGMGYMVTGRNEAALAELRAVSLDPSLPKRGAVDSHADLARVCAQLDEPEQACVDLHEALDLTLEAGYRMGIERILGVRAQFPATWTGLPCVVELDERLRLV